jgi:hypothetical protein
MVMVRPKARTKPRMAECTSQNDRRWMALIRIITKAGMMPQMMARSQTWSDQHSDVTATGSAVAQRLES